MVRNVKLSVQQTELLLLGLFVRPRQDNLSGSFAYGR